MKVPLSWLSDFIDLPTRDPRKLADTLAMVGHEVDGVEELDVGWSDVVIARVISVKTHPNADKIRLCQVTTGGDPIDVVCGAWNFEAGATVPYAIPGAVLGDDFEIGVRTIRGVESHGMICSESELGIGSDHDGILVLDDDAPVGSPLEEVIELPDVVFDLEITSNRPDAMSIVGVARDLAAWYDIEYSIPPLDISTGTIEAEMPLKIEIVDGSPRFVARQIDGVQVRPSPLRVRHRLRKIGVRSISNLVDVTNYVMLELGQPLHVFDADKLSGDTLVVRRAEEGEKLVTLDGVSRELRTEDVIICDSTGPISLAGTMGGETTEASDDTTSILLEGAAWHSPSIMYTSRFHGLRSEASARFERGVDPNLPPQATERAAAMIAQLSGGEIRSGWIDEVAEKIEPMKISLELDYVARVLGRDFDLSLCADLLRRLEMKVEGDDPLTVTVPTYRPDVTRPADLVEEIARIHSYEKFPSRLRPGLSGTPTVEQNRRRSLQRLLADKGVHQAITLSLIDPTDVTAFKPPDDHEWSRRVMVKNPLREDEALLRPSLLPGLLRSLTYNQRRGTPDVALFEIGRVFHADPWESDPRVPSQPERLGIVLSGAFGNLDLARKGRESDIFTILSLMRAIGYRLDLDLKPSRDTAPGLHPTRTALVSLDDAPLGYVGELHPETASTFELTGRIAVAELNLEKLLQSPGLTSFQPVSGYPHLDFDLSFEVPDEVTAASLVDTTSQAGGELVEWARVFDSFTGGNVTESHRAIAIRYRLRGARTLTTEDETPVRRAMIDAAAGLGASLRGAK